MAAGPLFEQCQIMVQSRRVRISDFSGCSADESFLSRRGGDLHQLRARLVFAWGYSSCQRPLRQKVSRHMRASSPAVVQNWPVRLKRHWYWRQVDSMAPEPNGWLAKVICSAVAVPASTASLAAMISL